jgi:hypothetical protein
MGFAPYYRGGIVMACMLLLWLPGRRRARPLIVGVMLLGIASFAMGCSGSNSPSGGGGTQTPVTPVNAPAATYNVVVTAVGGGVTHTARLTVIVP